MLQFCIDIKDTTKSINSDIHNLKSECLEGFAMVEQCRATSQRNQVKLMVYSHMRLIELLRLCEGLSAFTPDFCFTILTATIPQNVCMKLG